MEREAEVMSKQLTKEQSRLTEKQELFSIAYYTLGSETFGNATLSAQAAKYKGNENVLARQGHENTRNPKIIARKAVIQGVIVKKYELKAEAVINRLCKLAGLSPAAKDDKLPPTSEQGQLRSLELLGKKLDLWSDTGQSQAVAITIAAPEPAQPAQPVISQSFDLKPPTLDAEPLKLDTLPTQPLTENVDTVEAEAC